MFAIKGDGAYSVFKYEGGTHRVQRVPETESQGRIHTSTATVAVMPEVEEVEVEIEENDLKIDVYRSTGPGGQSVNTTDSAVRITHLPTGSSSRCRTRSRSSRTRSKAMRVLRARLYELERERQQAELAAQRSSQIGTRRAGREDPHVQLSREPGHRPPDQADRAPARPGARRASSTSSPRRSQAEERRRALEERDRRRGARGARAELSREGVETARVDAELLVAHALGAARIELVTRARPAARREASTRARELVARRARREPLAYILGEWGFRRLDAGRRPACAHPAARDGDRRRACLALLRARRAARARRRHRQRRDRARDRRRASGRARDRDRRLGRRARARARERGADRSEIDSLSATCAPGCPAARTTSSSRTRPTSSRRSSPTLEPEVRDCEPRVALVGSGATRRSLGARSTCCARRRARARGGDGAGRRRRRAARASSATRESRRRPTSPGATGSSRAAMADVEARSPRSEAASSWSSPPTPSTASAATAVPARGRSRRLYNAKGRTRPAVGAHRPRRGGAPRVRAGGARPSALIVGALCRAPTRSYCRTRVAVRWLCGERTDVDRCTRAGLDGKAATFSPVSA